VTFRIIVSDSSCLIDLHKTRLMEAFLGLPFEILMPDVMFETELLSITPTEKQHWLDLGLKVENFPGEQVLEATAVRRQTPTLSDIDCFAYVLVRHREQAVLFTGDSRLRGYAETQGIEVHGLIWGLELMHQHQVCRTDALLLAVQELLQDPLARLPKAELERLRKRLIALTRT